MKDSFCKQMLLFVFRKPLNYLNKFLGLSCNMKRKTRTTSTN